MVEQLQVVAHDEQRAREAALFRGAVQPRQNRGRNIDFECAQQAQAERQEQRRDESIDPRIGTQRHDAERPQQSRGQQAQPRKQHHDSQAKDRRLRDALPAPARWPAEEVGHGDGNHRKHAGREEGGQPKPERDQQKRVRLAACPAGRWDRLSLRVSRRNRFYHPLHRGVHGQVRHTRPPPLYALFVIACLVACIHGELRRTSGGALLNLQFQEKRNLVLVSLRIGIEVRVESPLGRRLEHAIPLHHRIVSEQNGGRRGRRRRHGIQVPARVDAGRRADSDGRASGRG